MFRHEGPSRSLQTNVLVAGYLAFVAGFVNSGGFIMIGSFTSHVTGSVGRIGTDIAAGEPAAAALDVLLVVTFFAGAFGATLLIEGHPPESISRAYDVILRMGPWEPNDALLNPQSGEHAINEMVRYKVLTAPVAFVKWATTVHVKAAVEKFGTAK